jgi:hypothetical protein
MKIGKYTGKEYGYEIPDSFIERNEEIHKKTDIQRAKDLIVDVDKYNQIKGIIKPSLTFDEAFALVKAEVCDNDDDDN